MAVRSSPARHFPDEMQGDFLLNNCIGFQGTLQYRFKQDDKPYSGFHADPVEPLVRSSDPNYRPVDLQLGPDGALYIADWFNPLVGICSTRCVIRTATTFMDESGV